MTDEEPELVDPAKPIINDVELADLVNTVYRTATLAVLRRLREKGFITVSDYVVASKDLLVYSVLCSHCGTQIMHPRICCLACRSLLTQFLGPK